MRVALLGPGFPYRGGIVHFNSRLAKEIFKTKGFKLDLYYWKKLYPKILLPKNESKFIDIKSKEKFIHKGRTLLNYSNPFSWLKLFLNVKKQKNNLFITHWAQSIHFPVYFFLFLLFRSFSSIKIVLIAHNVEQHEKSIFDNLFTKLLFKLSHKIVVHSSEEFKKANKMISSKKIILAFHPLYNIFPLLKDFNIQKFKKELGLKKKVILFFGFIRPYKGLEYLIKAFGKLSTEFNDLSLLIVGELFWNSSGEKQSLLHRLIKFLFLKTATDAYNPLYLIEKCHFKNRVILVNKYVPNEDVSKYFLVSDVLVAPYLSASQSGPVQIAYAFNKPVIVSKVGGLKDIVQDSVTGYFTNVKDSNDIAAKIKKFFIEKKITCHGIETYKEHFSWEKYLSLIIDTL